MKDVKSARTKQGLKNQRDAVKKAFEVLNEGNIEQHYVVQLKEEFERTLHRISAHIQKAKE